MSYRLHVEVSLGRAFAGLFAAGSVYVLALVIADAAVSVEGVVAAFVLAVALGVDSVSTSAGE